MDRGCRDTTGSAKKHPCPDCTFCQWCGDDRCALCLRPAATPKRKLSVAEQLALYDAINRGEHPDDKH